MNTASQEALAQLGTTMDQMEQDTQKAFEEGGLTVYQLSAEEQQRWIDAQQPLEESWISDMKAQGLDGAQVLASIRELAQ